MDGALVFSKDLLRLLIRLIFKPHLTRTTQMSLVVLKPNDIQFAVS